MKKQVTIITIPLVVYHGSIYWCLYNEHTGKIREDLLNRPTGGKQIPFAFEKALSIESDILILTDDKFTFEKGRGKNLPSCDEIEEFLKKYPLPETWTTTLREYNKTSCVVLPPRQFECTPYSFSEKKIYRESDGGLPGECANEWALLLEYLEKVGYEEIHAYIPKACAKGICYATPYAQENGLWVKPITIEFTNKDNVDFEYKTTI